MLSWDVKDVPMEFDVEQYLKYLPEDTEKYTFLRDLLATKGYGWVSRARVLMRIANLHETFDKLITEEEAKLDRLSRKLLKAGPGLRKRIELTPDQHLQAYLVSLSPEQLHAVAERANVSWTSYGDDTEGLIGHIMEVMAAVEVVA